LIQNNNNIKRDRYSQVSRRLDTLNSITNLNKYAFMYAFRRSN